MFGMADLRFRERPNVSTTVTRTLAPLCEVGIVVVCHDVLRVGENESRSE